ncbi:MAG: hypothetical protein ABII13_00345 [Patescibacteria group bacterium]
MKKTFIALICVVALIPFYVSAQAVADAHNSVLGADQTELKADGIDNARISVIVKNSNLMPMVGKKVTLISSRGSKDEIRVESDVTNLFGKAYFRVFSLKDGVATFTAVVDDVLIEHTIKITFSGGLSISLQTGDLIKIPDDSNVDTLSDTAVYYYASDGKRYVFPNEKTYFTWYQDFADVKIVPIDQMSLVPIGGNVTYRPGTRMIKFQTDVKTYIVTRGGTLRWAKTEDVARGWFGDNWNTYVDDVSEAFYENYTFGEPVESHWDLALEVIKDSTRSIDVDKRLGG